MHKVGWNDVPTSRRWVNKNKSQQAAKSRRLNVATLQCHDVSASFYLSIIKSKGGLEFEASKIIRTRARKSEQQDLDLEEGTDFCIFFFSDKSTDVL